nr:unnamed protein product [Callosobruchus analis]
MTTQNLVCSLAFLFFHTVVFKCITDAQNITVTTANGKILGRQNQTSDGTVYYAFKGIRYAQPPLDDLRFEPPVPIEAWNGTYDATEDKSECMQGATGEGSEDCLFLSVYTPSINPSSPLPVLVWIHGGYLLIGDASFDSQSKLGMFGFASTGDEVLPGNIGHKDQLLALKWVQENVEYFGGDKDKVTLGGQSAGAVSTSLLVQSPLAKGLFRSAIMNSGTSLCLWARARRSNETSYRTGLLTGLISITEDSAKLKDHLKKVDAKALQIATEAAFAMITAKDPLAGLGLGTVMEPYSEDAIFANNSYDMLSDGNFNQVPMLYVSESQFVRPIREFVRQASKHVPVYFYEFTYEGEVLGANEGSYSGVGHSAELDFLFKKELNASDSDVLTRKRMKRMWANFVKHSNPTPEEESLLQNISWEPATANNNLTYLNIGDDLLLEENILEDTMQFWDDLYEEYGTGSYDTSVFTGTIVLAFSDSLIISLPNGKIKGLYQRTAHKGTPFYSFRGIPYAEPPVGSLRFKPPVKKSKWNGILDATEEGCQCVQSSKPVVGSEDCLFINVYTPSVRNSSYAVQPPDLFLDENLVFVMFNYRLGVFGFLSTEDLVLPGNNGLKDQVLALKWVQENIRYFGGNPGAVTLFGQSAGAASVSYHIQSPLSKAAIMDSGSSLCLWALNRRANETAFTIGKTMFLNTSSSQSLVDGLTSADYVALQEAATIASNLVALENPLAGIMFGPVMEPYHDGAFFYNKSDELLRSGEFHRVPVLMGVNSNEAVAANDIPNTLRLFFVKYDVNVTLIAPADLTNNTKKRKDAAKEIKSYFFNSGSLVPIPPESLTKVFNGPIRQTALDMRKYVDVYFYEFSYEGFLGKKMEVIEPPKEEGVGHAEELEYLFTQPSIKDIPQNDTLVQKKMQSNSHEGQLATKLNLVYTKSMDTFTITLPNGKIKGLYRRTAYKGTPYYSFRGIPYAEPPVGSLRFKSKNPNGMGYWMPQKKAANVFKALNHYAIQPPDLFLDENLVFVMFNYRLGVFGFLSTEDLVLPGNNGLKDQVLALKWVQENIRYFGGNPEAVTLFGQSAGAASVSGSSLCLWALNRRAKKTAFAIGKTMFLNITSSQSLIEGLTSADYVTLQEAATIASNLIALENPLAGIMFGPVMEPYHDGAFFYNKSEELLRAGEFHRVPVLMGVNSNEAVTANDIPGELRLFFVKYDINVALIAPEDLTNDTKRRQDAAEKIKPIRQTALDMRKHVDVYFYEFSYEGFLGRKTESIEPPEGEGVGHAEELGYLFTQPSIKDQSNSREKHLATKLNVGLFNDMIYMNIDLNMTIGVNPFNDEMKFYDGIYEKYGNPPYDTY